MSRATVVAVVFLMLSGVAAAGPNAGGTIFVHDPGLRYQGYGQAYCSMGTPPASCESAVTQLDGNDDSPWVWKVYAAFKPCTLPRLKALDFSISYNAWPGDPNGIVILDHGACIADTPHEGEYPDYGWPGSGTGDVLVFQYTQTTRLVEMYWFAGYAYHGGAGYFRLAPGRYGGQFADDSVPALLDPIAGYGALGFNQPGTLTCPSAEAEGACCVGSDCWMKCEIDCQGTFLGPGTPCDPNPCEHHVGACCIPICLCAIMDENDCLSHGGNYMGDNSSCDPNPCCPVVPTRIESWGQIKRAYR